MAGTPGNDSNTILLIHSDDDDGDVDIVDSAIAGAVPHTINLTGNVHHEVDQQKFGATAIYFDGDDHLDSPDSPDWDLGTGDFCVDGWVWVAAIPVASRLISRGAVDVNNGDWTFGFGTNGGWGGGTRLNFAVRSGGSITDFSSDSLTMNTSTWHHIEFDRVGGSGYLFLDGVLKVTPGSLPQSIDGSNELLMGVRDSGGGFVNYLTGYIDELRFSNRGRHTSNFTPETSAYVTVDVPSETAAPTTGLVNSGGMIGGQII